MGAELNPRANSIDELVVSSPFSGLLHKGAYILGAGIASIALAGCSLPRSVNVDPPAEKQVISIPYSILLFCPIDIRTDLFEYKVPSSFIEAYGLNLGENSPKQVNIYLANGDRVLVHKAKGTFLISLPGFSGQKRLDFENDLRSRDDVVRVLDDVALQYISSKDDSAELLRLLSRFPSGYSADQIRDMVSSAESIEVYASGDARVVIAGDSQVPLRFGRYDATVIGALVHYGINSTN